MEESELLKKIAAWVDAKKENEQTGWWSKIVSFFAILVALIGFAWIYSRQSSELAKLQHEKNKRQLEEENKQVQQAAETNEAKRQQLSNEIAELRDQKAEIDKKIEAVKAVRQADKARIDSINSWSDI